MAKWPEPGRSKTRLCPPLSPLQAAELARCFLVDMAAELATLDLQCCVACTPAASAGEFRALLGSGVVLLPADVEGFGAALLDAQEGAFGLGFKRVALVGADLPHLRADVYRQGFDLLDQSEVVMGPSTDGGYYFLGTHRPTPELFEAVDWSTERVARQTRDRADVAGLRLAVAPPCDDVDTPADLGWLTPLLQRERPASATLAYLQTLQQAVDRIAAGQDAAWLARSTT